MTAYYAFLFLLVLINCVVRP